MATGKTIDTVPDMLLVLFITESSPLKAASECQDVLMFHL